MSRAGPTPPPPAVALYAQPSDVTLVKDFLRPWVTSGDTNAGAYVHAADLYSADPEELARRFQPAASMDGGDLTWYFLSPLRSKSPRDRRKVRAVADGTGCWHSEAGPKDVVDHADGGRHVGYRQAFSFMRRGVAGAGRDARTGWIMAEFHLRHGDDDGLGKRVEGLVLCKMYRSPRSHVVPVAAAADVVNDISFSVETMFTCRDEESNVVTSRWKRRVIENPDGATTATLMTAPTLKKKDSAATATVMTTPPLKKKAVDDGEVSSAPTGAAPYPKDKAVVATDKEELLALLLKKKDGVATATVMTTTPLKKKDGVATTTVMTTPPLKKKAVGDDKVSSATTVAIPCPKNKAVAVADHEELLLLAPPRKKMRVVVVNPESSDAVPALNATTTDAHAVAAQLHCPQCGFHLAALQALVTLTKSKSVVHGEMQEILRDPKGDREEHKP